MISRRNNRGWSRRPLKPPPRLLLGVGLVIAAATLLPLLYLFIRASGAGAEGWRYFLRPRVWQVFWNSIALAAITTTGSVLIGVPLAWITSRSDVPGRRFWSMAAILPLAIPSYIAAYAYKALLAPRGMAARALEPLGVERMPELSGLFGAALVITLINYPFVVLNVRAALRRMDPSLEEAARGLGCSPLGYFRRVLLPNLRPSIAAGSLLVALYTLSDFGTPALMRFNSFTRVIYTQYRSSFDRSTAALMALMLVAITVVVLFGETLTRGRATYHRSGGGSPRPAAPVALGRWRWPAFGFCALAAGLSLATPVLVILYWAVQGANQTGAIHLAPQLVVNSIKTAVLAGACGVAAALPVAFLAVRYRGRAVTLVDRATYLSNALPGIVVALALVFFGARWMGWIYQTLVLLVFAYVIRFLPQAIGALRTSLLQVPPRLEEAARSLGRSRLAAFTSVTVPLIVPGMAAGMALVFLTTIKELPLTLILSPPGFETLVTEVWSAASEGLFAQASVPALVLIGVSAFSVILILQQERRLRVT